MGPIWATHIWANPYGTHAEPDCTPHMGSPYGTHIGMFAGLDISNVPTEFNVPACVKSQNNTQK